MKTLSVFTIILILVAAGLGAKMYFDQKERALEYPVHRTITSIDGRTLDVVIHGRSETELVIERLDDSEKFDLPITNLSAEDQELAYSLPVTRKMETATTDQQTSSRSSNNPDPYIQSRLSAIDDLRSKIKVLDNEIGSGSLNSMLLKNREGERERVTKEIEDLQSAITQYKYRNKTE